MDGWLVSFWKVVGVLLGTQGLGFVLLSSPGHHPVPGPYLWQKPVAWLFLPSAATLLSDALASHPPFLGFKPWTSSLPTCQALPLPRVSSDDGLEWCGRGPCCLGQGAGAAFCLPGTVGEPCLVPLVDNIPTVPWASLCVLTITPALPPLLPWGQVPGAWLLSHHSGGHGQACVACPWSALLTRPEGRLPRSS